MPFPRTIIKNKCKYCGKEFEHRRPSDRGNVVYCSPHCRSLGMSKRVIVKCDYCGNKLSIIVSSFNKYKKHFCNRECRGKFDRKRIVKYCSFCGKPINRNKAAFCYYRSSSGNFFCNSSCKNAYKRMNGTKSAKLEKLARMRLESLCGKILKRDNFTCQYCGSKIKPRVHHIRRFASIIKDVCSLYPHLSINNDVSLLADLIVEAHKYSDLITLCEKCHIELHKKSGELQESDIANLQPSPISQEMGKVQRLMADERIMPTRVPDTIEELLNRDDIVRTLEKSKEVKDKEL